MELNINERNTKMKNYKLITFVNRGTINNSIWEIYGIVNSNHNDCIGTFETEEDAMKKAHSFCKPVMKGFSNSYIVTEILEKLEVEMK